MSVSKLVEERFKDRLESFKALVKEFDIKYEQIGIFGSYARGDYKASSDIDVCIITNNRPNMMISGAFREEADLLGVDVVYLSQDSFINSERLFVKKLRKDYKKIL